MKQSVSIPVLALSMIWTTIIPYLVGRGMCVHRLLHSMNKVNKTPFIPVSSLFSVSSGGTTNEEEGHIKHVHSRTCQSLGIDIDMLRADVLSSFIQIENFLSQIIMASDSFGRSPILRPPQCHSQPVRSTSISNQQQQQQQRLYCDTFLLNSHLHIYTWPQSGAISIDIFSCNADDTLVSLLPTIKELVGVTKSTKEQEVSTVRWHYKLRGDRSDDGHSAFMSGDMDQFLCSWIDFDVKELVVSIDTDYQTIDIFDTINPRFKTRDDYYASLQNDGSYHATHPELFRPDRIIYLDGILQSRYFGDAAYHEALVHPALFTHPNPKRVAIIGGGEGATLREVLKHNTIETVTMIEIDELMVNVSKQYIPEWSDCSMIVGSTPSCFDDPRAEVFYTDAIAWFIQRYLDTDTIDNDLLYDIIIMDALDPESSTEFSTVLYNDGDFMKSISNALRLDGILVSQLGENSSYESPGLQYTPKAIEYAFMDNLIGNGFDRMEDYIEAHGGFLGSWKYKMLFKCRSCNYSRWHTNQAMMDLEMKRRSRKCINHCHLFKFFDSATMMGYQFTSRINEAVFCRDAPHLLPDMKALWCDNRHGYDPDIDHYRSQQLFSPSTTTEFVVGGKGNSAAVGILPSLMTNYSYVGLDDVTQNIIILPTTSNSIRRMRDELLSSNVPASIRNRWNLWNDVIDSACTPCTYWGTSCCFVSLRSLVKHAAFYTINWSINNQPVAREGIVQNITSSLESVIYNPYVSRNHFNFQWIIDMTMMMTASPSNIETTA